MYLFRIIFAAFYQQRAIGSPTHKEITPILSKTLNWSDFCATSHRQNFVFFWRSYNSVLTSNKKAQYQKTSSWHCVDASGTFHFTTFYHIRLFLSRKSYRQKPTRTLLLKLSLFDNLDLELLRIDDTFGSALSAKQSKWCITTPCKTRNFPTLALCKSGHRVKGLTVLLGL